MDIELPISDAELARRLNISPQAVGKWSRVPNGQVLKVSEAIDWQVTPHQMRPDLYPHPDDGLPEHLRGKHRNGECCPKEPA